MSLETLRQAAKRTVGVKQTEKAVLKKTAICVYIACDADERVTGRLTGLCRESGVETVTTENMADIGKACGINVKAAAAGILKTDKGSAS